MVPEGVVVLGEEVVVEVLENAQWRLHADWRHLLRRGHHYHGRCGRHCDRHHDRHDHRDHRSRVVAPYRLHI